ncbi:prepilin peptidase [Sphingomonas bacterium]|uniref:A24 family peptidase n=1 Tax=Sphingomonas bacterium TaxID=1895847 RepID=UPI00262C925F|nr:prepilin peptidase [Sphingomonas bacterium]MDB5677196.1 peptidase [Sphingomonas bacterium]
MGWGFLSYALVAALVLILLSAGIEDARTREIANWKNAAIALMAPAWWYVQGYGWSDAAIQLAIAVGVFAVFVGAFHFGWMGGGDVKMIGALALWLPGQALLSMLVIMSVIGGALTLIMMLDHWRRKAPGAVETPYGVAIAMASMIALSEPIFNQFT